MNKLGVIVYKATKLETFLSRFLPYYIPFINKRRRVKIKWYFKYRYRRRLSNALVKMLKSLPPPKFEKIDYNDFNWEWEVIHG